MLYLVRTLKEYDWKRVNTDFVLEADDVLTVKDFFNDHKIIILWISQVQGWPSSWEFFWTFQINDSILSKFCLKSDTIESVVQRCVDLDLPIIDVQNKKNTISKEFSDKLIKETQERRNAKENKEEEIEKEKKKKEEKTMDNRKKDKILKVIGETLIEIGTLEQMYANNTNVINERKKLSNLKEQLTKIRMWSNLEKATSILEETFSVMEEIEMSTIDEMKDNEEKISQSSIVSNVDIVSELDKIKRAQQANKAGTKKTSSDLYYTYLGIIGLYQKFIAKDILNKISHIKIISDQFISYIWFSILVTIIWSSIIFEYYIITDKLSYNIFLWMIGIWVFGLLRTPISCLKGKSSVWHISYIILAIIATIIIYKGILIFFALV